MVNAIPLGCRCIEVRRVWYPEGAPIGEGMFIHRCVECLEVFHRIGDDRYAPEPVATTAAFETCPCCKRTFKQLAAHMKNKHPEFAHGSSAEGEG